MLLYPQLPPAFARVLADELLSKSIQDLFALSSTSHHSAIYAPTGGIRVSESHLHKVNQCIRENAIKSDYPAPLTGLNTQSFDASLGRILYEILEITPSEASNLGIWAFMSCVMWPDLVRWRFPGGTDGTSRERFVGGRRNTFGRMWWRAYLLREPNSEHPYKLLDLLGEDELVQIMERPSLAGNSPLIREIYRTFLHITNTSSNTLQSRSLLRDVTKRLRRLLPMVSFEALDDSVLKSLISDIFEKSLDNTLRDDML